MFLRFLLAKWSQNMRPRNAFQTEAKKVGSPSCTANLIPIESLEMDGHMGSNNSD